MLLPKTLALLAALGLILPQPQTASWAEVVARWAVVGSGQVLGVSGGAAVPVDSLLKGSRPDVYYYAADGFLYVFPNAKTFGSWFGDYGRVVTVPDAVLATLPLRGNVTYRPGVRLVKLPIHPQVYAVERGGSLRPIPSEDVAAALYGPDWMRQVDDLPPAFFTNYQLGEPVGDPTAYDPQAALAHAPTINQDRGLPESGNAPRATSVVGGTTTPAAQPAVPAQPAEPREDRGPATPAEPPQPAATSTPTTTPPVAQPAQPACPQFQQHDVARGGCAPARDTRCGANGYRDRFGGCVQLPVGRTLVADWAVCGDKSCDLERGEHSGTCPADCPGIATPAGWATSTPTTTPSGTTPAVPATPATPASGSSGTTTTPAPPAPTTASSTPTTTPATATPVISSIQVSAIAQTEATVTWTTNVAATSEVAYSTQAGQAAAGEHRLGAWGTNHSVTLPSLTPSTTYSVVAISDNDQGGRATSGEQSFTTLPAQAACSGGVTATIDFEDDPAVGSNISGNASRIAWLSAKGIDVTGSPSGYVWSTKMSGGAGATGVVLGYASPSFAEADTGVSDDETLTVRFLNQPAKSVSLQLVAMPSAVAGSNNATTTVAVETFNAADGSVAVASQTFTGVTNGALTPATVSLAASDFAIAKITLRATQYPYGFGGVWLDGLTATMACP